MCCNICTHLEERLGAEILRLKNFEDVETEAEQDSLKGVETMKERLVAPDLHKFHDWESLRFDLIFSK